MTERRMSDTYGYIPCRSKAGSAHKGWRDANSPLGAVTYWFGGGYRATSLT